MNINFDSDFLEVLLGDKKELTQALHDSGFQFEYMIAYEVKKMLERALYKIRKSEANLEEKKDAWRRRVIAVQKFRDEENNRKYTTPVREYEMLAARKKRNMSRGRLEDRKKKFGKFYFDTFDAWLIRLIDERGSICQICGKEKRRSSLTVHHRHYRTKGEETSRDFALVCKKCHYDFHVAYKNGPLLPEHLAMIDRDNEYKLSCVIPCRFDEVEAKCEEVQCETVSYNESFLDELLMYGFPREKFCPPSVE